MGEKNDQNKIHAMNLIIKLWTFIKQWNQDLKLPQMPNLDAI
jgi:hypothetical protein